MEYYALMKRRWLLPVNVYETNRTADVTFMTEAHLLQSGCVVYFLLYGRFIRYPILLLLRSLLLLLLLLQYEYQTVEG